MIRIGSVVRGHRLLRKLGEGAMGTVYEGVHEIIGKRVAIKVLKNRGAGDPLATKRMLEEARAVNAIRHDGVVDVYDMGMFPDGRPFLVMELLEGRNLHDLMGDFPGGMPLSLVLHVLQGILRALAAAHRAGVIHRDLKGSNVFLVDQPEGPPFVKLVDFGVARRADRTEMLTLPKMTVGSAGFMAPEHIAGEPVPASDLYATGCLAWIMLTGAPVFPYGEPGALIQRHLSTKPPLVNLLRPEVSPEMAAWLAWLLEKRAEDRPTTAELALASLQDASSAGAAMRTFPGGPKFIPKRKGTGDATTRDGKDPAPTSPMRGSASRSPVARQIRRPELLPFDLDPERTVAPPDRRKR